MPAEKKDGAKASKTDKTVEDNAEISDEYMKDEVKPSSGSSSSSTTSTSTATTVTTSSPDTDSTSTTEDTSKSKPTSKAVSATKAKVATDLPLPADETPSLEKYGGWIHPLKSGATEGEIEDPDKSPSKREKVTEISPTEATNKVDASKKSQIPVEDALAADETPSLDKFGGWLHPLKSGATEGEIEDPDKSPPKKETVTTTTDVAVAPKKSSPEAAPKEDSEGPAEPAIRYEKFKKDQKKVRHQKIETKMKTRRKPHTKKMASLPDAGGTCCKHCCCCQCHDVDFPYQYEEIKENRYRNRDHHPKPFARQKLGKRKGPREVPVSPRNSISKRRRIEDMERLIEDDCLEDTGLASVKVNSANENFQQAITECTPQDGGKDHVKVEQNGNEKDEDS